MTIFFVSFRIFVRIVGAAERCAESILYSLMYGLKLSKVVMAAVLTVAVVCAGGCNRQKELVEQQDEKILSWLQRTYEEDEYDILEKGLYRVVTIPESGKGVPEAAQGDSLYVMYEIYKFESSLSRTQANLLYSNKADLMPDGVAWGRDTLRFRLGDGRVMRGVEKALAGAAPEDEVIVLMTSDHAYGDHTVQQLPPNTAIAWCVDVEKVMNN